MFSKFHARHQEYFFIYLKLRFIKPCRPVVWSRSTKFRVG